MYELMVKLRGNIKNSATCADDFLWAIGCRDICNDGELCRYVSERDKNSQEEMKISSFLQRT